MRPRRQANGCLWLSMTTTMSFTLVLGIAVTHVERSWRVVRYSDDQRLQKSWWHWSKIFHQWVRLNLAFRFDREDTANKGCPIKKSPGLNHSRSCGSLHTEINGSKSLYSSQDCSQFFIAENMSIYDTYDCMSDRLVDHTAASHKPPKKGALGRLNCHSQIVWEFATGSCHSGLLIRACNCFLDSRIQPGNPSSIVLIETAPRASYRAMLN